jgi:hypothetical protein
MSKDEVIRNYIAELDKQYESSIVKLKVETMEKEYQARKKAYPELTEEQLKSSNFHADRLEGMLSITNKILEVPNETD